MIAQAGLLMYKSGVVSALEDTACTQRYRYANYLIVSIDLERIKSMSLGETKKIAK
jgi:hypothetical protein